ncbi:coactosin [Podarcis lilfordi]|uniref:Coactosin-like protein n=2 Tax=Podarcis TaxID=42163 RepID=A0AA35KQF1_9SAUR|nr:coactosin [Podarcis lilfordi]
MHAFQRLPTSFATQTHTPQPIASPHRNPSNALQNRKDTVGWSRRQRRVYIEMATKIDKEACREAYNLVRDDGTDVNWVTFKYEGSTIVPGHHGADYEEFIRQCTDDIRLFGFVRFTTGDAMSKRVKFALITWIGESVSGLQRAKTGTDKTLVKEVVQNFAKEFVISDHKELDEDYIKSELKKAGGANYDAQAE